MTPRIAAVAATLALTITACGSEPATPLTWETAPTQTDILDASESECADNPSPDLCSAGFYWAAETSRNQAVEEGVTTLDYGICEAGESSDSMYVLGCLDGVEWTQAQIDAVQ